MADLCSDHDIFDPLDDSSCAQEINFSFLEETDSSSEYDVCDISEDEEHLNFEKQSGDRRGRPKGTKRKADFSEQCQPRKKHQKVPLQQLNCYGCCILLCMSLIPIEDLERLRTFTANLSVTELSNWVLDLLWLHKSENTQFCYMLGEWRMCTAAFLLTIGMPLTTFYSIRKKFKAGVKEIDKRGKPVGKTTPKVQTATVWLIEYANKYADKLPNSTKLHLPSCLTKDSIYNIMTEELEDKEEEIVSKSHFYYIWRTCLSHIAIPPTSRFSKCNTCSKIKTQLGETKDKTKRKQLISLRQKHLMKQSIERRKYYKHSMKGRTEPDKYLSIILDGMDQKKTELPHYLYLSSFVSSLWKLKTHLVGVIVHGIGNYGFFDYYQYPHGSNLTIHCLLSTLYMQKDSLPDTLYLQMDNCARENKNRYILGFLCLLVEKDIFKKVKLSFLMVGHTHEDIDQMFSRFSVRLRRTPAMTLDKLMSIFEKCTTPKPLSVECDNVYNVTEWLQEYLNPISGQSRPHVFRITKGETGKAEICWKNWTTDKEYNKSIGDLPHLLKAIPDGSPNCLQESFEKIDVEVLKRDIEKAAPFFPKPEERQWWTSFFEKIENNDTELGINDRSGKWMLDDIITAKQRSRINREPDVREVVTDGIEVEAEEIVQLIIGKKSKKTNDVCQLKDGDMALTDLPKYAGEWPQVGQVVSVLGNTVRMRWYKGCTTGIWTPCSVPEKGKKGKKIAFVEDIPLSSIWLWGFKLTEKGYLKKQTRESIDAYKDF